MPRPARPYARRLAGGLVALALTGTGVAMLPGHAEAEEDPSAVHSVVTWSAASDRISDASLAAGLQDATVRNLVHTSIGGAGVRVSLSNEFGDRPVTFGSVRLAVHDEAAGGAAVRPGTERAVTFAGEPEVTIPPGGSVVSDRVRGRVPADTTLAVSLHVEGASGVPTGHNLAMQTSYLADGDATRERGGAAYDRTISSWLWVQSVRVDAPQEVGTVAFLGDSITDGHSSTPGANRRWPDLVADRLARSPAIERHGIANQGISANKVLADGAGQAAVTRFDRDVLAQPAVETVVVLEGINDIRWRTADSPDDLIGAYRQLVDRAHDRGLCAVGATLTPFEGADRYSPDREQIRTTVNDWIRTSGEFDAVIDFDAATRDPARPSRFLPAYDIGDHLHPNDAGYQAMADAVDLDVLECDR